MNDKPHGRQRGASWSRRDLVRVGIGVGASALLAACGEAAAAPTATTAPRAANTTSPTGVAATMTQPPPTAATAGIAAAAPTTVAAVAGTSPEAASFIMLPNSGAKLPTDKVTVRWLGSAGERKLFSDAMVVAYPKAHPNVTLLYDGLPFTDLAKVLPAGIQNGNGPDLFELPPGLTGPQVVQQGWVQPIDDLIPNFAQWKAAFPPGTFVEGSNMFKGKTYSFPFQSNKKNNAVLIYNADYMRQAGYDPTAMPFTWDEFRAAAKKLTQQGAGKYYGIVVAGGQASRLGDQVRFLAQMAGATTSGVGGPAQDMNLKTGEYGFASDQYLAAIDLIMGMKGDGSWFPGTVSLNVQQTDSMFARGIAAMMINGPYMFPQWRVDAPDFKYGVGSQPIPNTGKPSSLFYASGGGTYWTYAKTQQPGVVGDILSYAGSLPGQIALINIIAGSQPATFPQANAISTISPQAKKALELFDQQIKLAPSPAIRNPDVALVDLEYRALTPDIGSTVQGIFTAQLTDAKKAMLELRDRADKELDRAMKAAQAKGAKVSRDDYKFANWDPTRDFTEADYTAAK